MTPRTLCIYHGNCADGFGAAWAVRHSLGAANVEFHAAVHQTPPPPDLHDRDVIIVDFSYKADVMAELVKRVRSVLVLDHHKSAEEDLTPLAFKSGTGGCLQPRSWGHHLMNAGADLAEIGCANLYAIFDQNRSGAGLAWDFFHLSRPRPQLINHIEDRDLWRFAIPGTREVQAALFSFPYDFKVWDDLMLHLDSVDKLRHDGVGIERKHHKDVLELVTAFRREMCLAGYWVPVANLPYTLTSDAGHLMCAPYASPNLHGEMVTPPFAARYWDTPKGRTFSLRSVPGGMDVSEIAKTYGGGGHKDAAGFTVSFEAARAIELYAEAMGAK